MVTTQRVVDLLCLGRVREAAELISHLLVDNPEDVELVRLLGQACLMLGDGESALEHLDRAAALAPDAGSTHELRSVALLELGRRGEAEAAARTAVRLDPLAASHHVQLACTMSGDPTRVAEARHVAEHAVRLAPHDPAVHFGQGLVNHDIDRGIAIAAYREALRLEPANPAALNNLAILEQRLPWRRLRSFSDILAIDPQSTVVRTNLLSMVKGLAWLSFVGLWLVLRVLVTAGQGQLVGVVGACWVGAVAVVVTRLPRGVRASIPDAMLPRRQRARRAFQVLAVGVVVMVVGAFVTSSSAGTSGVGVFTLMAGMLVTCFGLIGAVWRMRS